ncbi:hypothetical protein X734_32470 [Mesorhizobium sp. L2C084A000]|nr:hypothetical protein X734_32470 [Mesorhizobium sp. L2C084A000]
MDTYLIHRICCDGDDCKVVSACLLESRRDASELLEPGKAAFDQVAQQLVAGVQIPIDKHLYAQRLTSIPGVGPIIAATIRATIQDRSAFKTAGDLAAWIRITPRANSSGGKERLGRISKQGN